LIKIRGYIEMKDTNKTQTHDKQTNKKYIKEAVSRRRLHGAAQL